MPHSLAADLLVMLTKQELRMTMFLSRTRSTLRMLLPKIPMIPLLVLELVVSVKEYPMHFVVEDVVHIAVCTKCADPLKVLTSIDVRRSDGEFG